MTSGSPNDTRPSAEGAPPARRLFQSTLLSRAICFLIANLSIALMIRLLTNPVAMQFQWWTQLALAGGMLLTSAFVWIHLWLHWIRPTAQATEALRLVRLGEAPIDELAKIIGGVAPLLDEVQEVLRSLRRQKAEIARVELETSQRVANRTDALERSLGAIRQQAARDALTGLYNRRMLDVMLPQVLQRCRAEGVPLSVMMIDVDDFKLLNDTLGHVAGDEFLRDLGQLVRSTLRETDMAFRYGGDEFVILLPNNNVASAKPMELRLTSLIDAMAKPPGLARPPRLSIGLVCTADLQPDIPAPLLVQEADRRLYHVKVARKARRRGKDIGERV